MTLKQLAKQALAESMAVPQGASKVTPGAVLELLSGNRRLTGQEIGFALGLGRDAKPEALAGGGVYAALADLMQARKITTDPATSRYFLRRA